MSRLRALFVLTMLLFLLSLSGYAQLVDEFEPPDTPCCLPVHAQRLANQLNDWNQLGRYHRENQELMKDSADDRVVFLGDSITDGWNLEQYFPGQPYINRGISGQTTPQMLVRMYPDVIKLNPRALVVLAATNDIAGNTGPQTAEMVQDNFRAMTELARAHDIEVVLCSLLPVSNYGPNPQTTRRPPSQILALNQWLQAYADETGSTYVDYYSAVVDEDGMLREDYSDDGLHPNQKGYEAMAPIVRQALEQLSGR